MEEYLAGYDEDDDYAGPSALRLGHAASSRRSSSSSRSSADSTSSDGSGRSAGSRQSHRPRRSRLHSRPGSIPDSHPLSPTSSSSYRSHRSNRSRGVTTSPAGSQYAADDADSDRDLELRGVSQDRIQGATLITRANGDEADTPSTSKSGAAETGPHHTSGSQDEAQHDIELEKDNALEVGNPGNGFEGPDHQEDTHHNDGLSSDSELSDHEMQEGDDIDDIYDEDDGDDRPNGAESPIDDPVTQELLLADADPGQNNPEPNDDTDESQNASELPVRSAPPLSIYKTDLYAHLTSTQSRALSLADTFPRSGNTCLPPFYRPWTASDRSRFFISLARHSRYRPDLVSVDVGRSEGDVRAYLDTLERGAAIVRKRRDRFDRAGLRDHLAEDNGAGEGNSLASEDFDTEVHGPRKAAAERAVGKKRKRANGGSTTTATPCAGPGWRYWREGFASGATTVCDEWLDVEERYAAEIEQEVQAETARRWREERFRRWGEITLEVKAAVERRRAQEQAGTNGPGLAASEVDAEVQRRIFREFGRAWDAGRDWGDVLDGDKLALLRRRLMKSRMHRDVGTLDGTAADRPRMERPDAEQDGIARGGDGGVAQTPLVKVERRTSGVSRPRPRRRLTDREDEIEARARRALVQRGRAERRTRRRQVMGNVPLEVLHARGVAFLQRLSEKRRAAVADEEEGGGPREQTEGTASGEIDLGSSDEDPQADTPRSRSHRQPILGMKLRTIRRNMRGFLRRRTGPTGIARTVSDHAPDEYARWDGQGPSGRQWVNLQLEEMGDKARIARAVRIWAGDELETDSDGPLEAEEGQDELDDLRDVAFDGGLVDRGVSEIEDPTRRAQGQRPRRTSHSAEADAPGWPPLLGRAWLRRRIECTEYADDAAYDFIRDFPRPLRSDAMREVYKRLRRRIRRRRDARMKTLVDDFGMQEHEVEGEGGADVVWRARNAQDRRTDDRQADLARMEDGGRGVSGEEWVAVLVAELGPVVPPGARPSLEATAYEGALQKAVEGPEAAHDRLADLFEHRAPGWTLRSAEESGDGNFQRVEYGLGLKAQAKAKKRRAKAEAAVRGDLEAAADMRDVKKMALVNVGGMSSTEIKTGGGVERCWKRRFRKVLGLGAARRDAAEGDLDSGNDTDVDIVGADAAIDGADAEEMARRLVDMYIATLDLNSQTPDDRDGAADNENRPVDEVQLANHALASASLERKAQSASSRFRMGARIPFRDSSEADEAAIAYLQGIKGGGEGEGDLVTWGGRELSADEKTVLIWLRQRRSARKREAKDYRTSADKRRDGGVWNDLSGAEWTRVLVALLRRAGGIGDAARAGPRQEECGKGPGQPGSSQSAGFFDQLFAHRRVPATKTRDARAAEWLNKEPRESRTGLQWIVLKYLENRVRIATKPPTLSNGFGGNEDDGDDPGEETGSDQTGEEWANALLQELQGEASATLVEGASKPVKVYDRGDLPSPEITEHLDDRAKAYILGINSRRRTGQHNAVLDFVDKRIRRRRNTRKTKLVKEGMSLREVKEAGGADEVWRAKLAGANEGLAVSADASKTPKRRNTRRGEASEQAQRKEEAQAKAAAQWKARRMRLASTTGRRVRVGGVDLDPSENGTDGRVWVDILGRLLAAGESEAASEHEEGARIRSHTGTDEDSEIGDHHRVHESEVSNDGASENDGAVDSDGDLVHSPVSQNRGYVSRHQRHVYDDLAIAYLRSKPMHAAGANSAAFAWTQDEQALLDRLIQAKATLRTKRCALLLKRFGLDKEEMARRGGVDKVWAERHPGTEHDGEQHEAMTGREWVRVLLREEKARNRRRHEDVADDPAEASDAQSDADMDNVAGPVSRDRATFAKWTQLYGRYAVEQLDDRALDYLYSLRKAPGPNNGHYNSTASRRGWKRKTADLDAQPSRTEAQEQLLLRLKRRREQRQYTRRDRLMRDFGLTAVGIDRKGGADVVWREKYPNQGTPGDQSSGGGSASTAHGGQGMIGSAVPDISGEEWTRMLLADVVRVRQRTADLQGGPRSQDEGHDSDDSEPDEDHAVRGMHGNLDSQSRADDSTQRASARTTGSNFVSDRKGGRHKLSRGTREILDIKAVEFILALPRQDRTTEQTSLVTHIQKAQRAGAAWRERVLLGRGWTADRIRAAGGITGAWWIRNDASGRKRNGETVDVEAVHTFGGKEWAEKRMKELGIWSKYANGPANVSGAREARDERETLARGKRSDAEPQNKREAMRLGMGEDDNGLNGWDVFDMGWFAKRLGIEDDTSRTMSGELLHHLRSELERFLTPLVAGSIIVAEQRRAQEGINSRSHTHHHAADDPGRDRVIEAHMDDGDEDDSENNGSDYENHVLENKPKRRRGAPPDAEISIHHVRTALALQGHSQRDPTHGRWVDDDHGRRLRAYRYVREGERWNMDPPRWIGWEVMHLQSAFSGQQELADEEGCDGGSQWEVESTQTDREEEELDLARDKMDEVIDGAEMDRLWGADDSSGDETGEETAIRPAKRRRIKQDNVATRQDCLPAVQEYKTTYARIMRARQTRRDIAARRAKTQEQWDAKTKTLVRGRYRSKNRLLSNRVIATDDEDEHEAGDDDKDHDEPDTDDNMVCSDGESGRMDEDDVNAGDEIDDMIVDDIDGE